MPEESLTKPLFILVVGLAMVASMPIKAVLERRGYPALVGYLGVGMLLRLVDREWPFLNHASTWALEMLAELGVICILFRVGLESDPRGLLRQMRRALPTWVGNVSLALVSGFVVTFYLLGFGLIPSLFAAVALSATSVGVSVMVWEDAGRMHTALGEELIDVAELDDLSAIILMIMLFAAVPVLQQGGTLVDLVQPVAVACGLVLLKTALLAGSCYLFARYLEKPITEFFSKFTRSPDPVIGVVGIGFVIAALAEFLGLSAAVGALFAGLAFSRDPDAVKMESSFMPLHELFTPFFFIGIGLQIEPDAVISSVGIGAVLLAVAVAGKYFGTLVPARRHHEMQAASLLAVSMIPRAEIGLIVARKGNTLGDWAVPDHLYGGMVFVSAVTCVASAVLLRRMFSRWPDEEAEGE
ncbi:cation:proton antiporter [Maioricimonas sp. JC845]|uniref:cation:proton antiporter n=1 Tax=Maioricimonas sp. JC845 TaxID=3232138 RepID=UPI00345AFE5A